MGDKFRLRQFDQVMAGTLRHVCRKIIAVWQLPIGCDFKQRKYDKIPLQSVGMRNGECRVRIGYLPLAIKDQVEINHPLTPMSGFDAPHLLFDGLESEKQTNRVERSVHQAHSVNKGRLVLGPLWLAKIQRGVRYDVCFGEGVQRAHGA